MNGQTMNYNRYLESLKNTPDVDVPRVKMDLQALVRYAREKGLRVSQLSGEEQRSFIKSCDKR